MTSLLRSTANRSILANTISLVGTTAITSVLGFVYWWLATQRFTPDVVGFASASVSAMLLLGTLGMLGFGTLLIAELPQHPGNEAPLIATTLLTVGIGGGALGAFFALIAPHIAPDLGALGRSGGSIALFAAGVAFTALTMVLDQALVGLLRGDYQFWRNALFAVGKLIALFAVAVVTSDTVGLSVYATWLIGNVISVGVLGVVAVARSRSVRAFRPRWRYVRGIGRSALGHHGLNMALQFPALTLPLVVTTILSTTANAYFYAAWMIAGFVFVGPGALTVALYAVGTRHRAEVARYVRFTLGLGVAGGVMANAVLVFGAPWILRVFGSAYAHEASWALRIIGLGVFPVIIKDHYVTIYRLRNRVSRATLWVAVGAALEIVAAAVGASIGGLTGLALLWLGAACIEAAGMMRAVIGAAHMDVPIPAGVHGARGGLLATIGQRSGRR